MVRVILDCFNISRVNFTGWPGAHSYRFIATIFVNTIIMILRVMKLNETKGYAFSIINTLFMRNKTDPIDVYKF